MYNVKNVLNSSLLLTVLVASSLRAADGAEKLIGLVSLAGAGVAILAAEKAGENPTVRRISRVINISPEDGKGVIGTSAGLFVISTFANDKVSAVTRSYSWRVPIYAAVGGAVTSKAFNEIVKRVPFVGQYLGGCSNVQCEGSCNNCKVRKGMVVTAVWVAITPLLNDLENRVKNRINGTS